MTLDSNILMDNILNKYVGDGGANHTYNSATADTPALLGGTGHTDLFSALTFREVASLFPKYSYLLPHNI